MDVILEAFDTFVADHVYAYLLPVQPAPYDFPKTSATNSSVPVLNSWTYKPATQFVQFTPSQAAYMSSWPRDNPLRQFMTLFSITWYVPSFHGLYEHAPC
jgi:lathosterol oxidase